MPCHVVFQISGSFIYRENLSPLIAVDSGLQNYGIPVKAVGES